MPPHIFAWFLMPTCRISILTPSSLTSILTSCRKSTRPSAVKKKVYLFPSNDFSTEKRFIFKPSFRMQSRQKVWADFSSERFFWRWLKSFSVAIRKTFLSGLPPGRFSNGFGGETTVPNPSPCSVSTMTWSPRFRTNAPLSKSYTLPAVLNRMPTTFFMVFSF